MPVRQRTFAPLALGCFLMRHAQVDPAANFIVHLAHLPVSYPLPYPCFLPYSRVPDFSLPWTGSPGSVRYQSRERWERP